MTWLSPWSFITILGRTISLEFFTNSPRWHTTSFKCPSNIKWMLWTLDERWNSVMLSLKTAKVKSFHHFKKMKKKAEKVCFSSRLNSEFRLRRKWDLVDFNNEEMREALKLFKSESNYHGRQDLFFPQVKFFLRLTYIGLRFCFLTIILATR